MVAERSRPNRIMPLFMFFFLNIVHSPLQKNMSASPPMISMSDEEDTCICEHKVTLVRVNCVKEEWERQREEEA